MRLAAALLLLLFGNLALAAPPQADCRLVAGEVLSGAVAEDFRTIVAGEGRFSPAGIAPPSLLAPNETELQDAALAALQAFLSRAGLQAERLSQRPDRHGRHAALIGRNETLLQEYLLRQGLALALPAGLGDKKPACTARFFAAEEEARGARQGLWARAEMVRNAHAPDALSSQYGRYVIVAGTIISVGNRPYRTYLNFGRDWSHDFTAEIARAQRAAFGDEAGLAALAGRTVRLRGFLKRRAGPVLELEAPWQLEVIAEKGPQGDD